MCCNTHDNHAYSADLLAPSEQYRCRCTAGPPCRRKATQEDLLCDVCRAQWGMVPQRVRDLYYPRQLGRPLGLFVSPDSGQCAPQFLVALTQPVHVLAGVQ